MKIFDAHIRSDTCSEGDLKHLSYFDTEHVITTAYAARPFESADSLKCYFEFLLGDESARLRRCGLTPHVALGVLPAARPRRAHYEIWRAMAEMLEDPLVVAVGEIGVWEDTSDQWELFEGQVHIALNADARPLIITPPLDLRITLSYKMMQMIESIGFPPSRVMINYADERFLNHILESGFCAGMAVGATTQEPRQAAALLAEVIEGGSAERIILNSALRAGAVDVLAIPKTIEALHELGVSQDAIYALASGNASALFLRPGS